MKSAKRLLCLSLLCSLFFATPQSVLGLEDPDPHRFDKYVAEISADGHSPGEILFFGSSSARMWDVKKCFPKLPTINHAFGGSQISDCIYFFDKLVKSCKPKVIVFYCGTNDLTAGKAPERVVKDFQTFITKLHKELPETRLIYVGICPNESRWKFLSKMRQANRAIREIAVNDPLLYFWDVDSLMLGEDGKPIKEFYLKDKLHLNQTGYAHWTKQLRPILEFVWERAGGASKNN